MNFNEGTFLIGYHWLQWESHHLALLIVLVRKTARGLLVNVDVEVRLILVLLTALFLHLLVIRPLKLDLGDPREALIREYSVIVCWLRRRLLRVLAALAVILR